MSFLFLIAALLAEVVGTIAGFGSSTIFLPLALFFLDFKTALVLVAFFHVFGNIGRISFFRHGLHKRLLLTFGIPSVIATLVGALLVTFISQELLKALLGSFLVVYAGISLGKDTLQFAATKQNALLGGSVSGFLAGLVGTGGALRGAFLTAFGLPKEQYITTAATIALAVDITRIPVYVQQGFLTPQYYSYLPLLLVVALSGSFIGKRIVDRVPQAQFKKIVLVALLAIGLKFMYDLS